MPLANSEIESRKLKIFCLGMSDPSWPGRIYRISKRINAQVIYWTGMRKRRNDVADLFPDAIFQELGSAIKGEYVKDIFYKKKYLPLDKKIIDRMMPYQVMAMKMMERLEPAIGSFSFEERLRHYHRLLKYWYNLLNIEKPDICLFPITPHACYDYIIYSLAQIMGIKTIILDRTAIPSRVLIGTTIDNTTMELEERYHSLLENSQSGQTKHILPEYIDDYLKRLKLSYAEGMPPNIRRKVGIMNIGGKLGLIGHSASIAAIFRYEFGFLRKQLLKGKKTLDDSYIKQIGRTPESSRVSVYNDIWIRIKAYRYKNKLQSYYIKHQQVPDYSVPYVFVALHYQPERNTVPLAGAFFEQCLLVEMLAAAIPKDWKIYVKEHNWQWSYFSKGERSRTIQQYRDMYRLKNVVFVPTDTVSFDLIDRAKATATIAGSTGWESINRGVPALIFGNAWYRNCEGAFRISGFEDLRSAVNLIKENYSIDQQKVRLFLRALEDVSIKTLIDTVREDKGELSISEINTNLVEAISSKISRELGVENNNDPEDVMLAQKDSLPIVAFLAEALTVLPEHILVAEKLLKQQKAYPIIYTTKKLYGYAKEKTNVEIQLIPEQRSSLKRRLKRKYLKSNVIGKLAVLIGVAAVFITSKEIVRENLYKAKKLYSFMLSKFLPSEATLKRTLIQRMEIASEQLQKNNVKVLITSDDRTMNHVMCWIKAANVLGIKTVLLPFAVTHPDVGAFIRRERYQMHINKGEDLSLKSAVAKQYPNTVYNSKYGAMLFYPPKNIRLLDSIGLLPKNPWIQGGGQTNHVLAIGHNDKNLMVEMGVNPEKITVAGQCSHDLVFESMQNRAQVKEYLKNTYEIQPDDKLIIFAVPHMAEINALTWDKHLEIFEQILTELAKLPAKVVLSLHPRAQVEKYKTLAKAANMPILNKALSEVLPAGDIFLATHSSTVRWAGMCNIPPVILDYDFGYEFLNDIDGAITIKLPSDIPSAMLPLLTDSFALADIKRRLKESTDKFAVFDGKATQRAVDLICSDLDVINEYSSTEKKYAA